MSKSGPLTVVWLMSPDSQEREILGLKLPLSCNGA